MKTNIASQQPDSHLLDALLEPAEPKHVLVRDRFIRVPRKLTLAPLATAQIALRVEFEQAPEFTVPVVPVTTPPVPAEGQS